MAKVLTKDQVLDRLKAKIAQAGSQSRFAKIHGTHASAINLALSGQYKGVAPPSVLSLIQVEKRVVYVLVEAKAAA